KKDREGRPTVPFVRRSSPGSDGTELVRCLAPGGSVIHAHQDSGCCRIRVEGATNRADTRAECEMIIVAQVHEVAFEEGRPAAREHPFNATTRRPACPGVAVAAEGQTSYGDVCAGLNPGRATLTVEQPAGRERVANTARQGIEPVDVEVSRA